MPPAPNLAKQPIGDHLDWILIGEPAQRPDGRTLFLYKTGDGVEVLVDSSGSFYSDDEVMVLDDGNWGAGLIRVAQARYSDTWPGKSRPYQPELEGLTD